ncbi:hypothetical protein [Alkalimonas mucilaginosa]|uniref:Carboxypeptidase regulatory-like domain-containing protein n=1 Tax=Alkalimonas mucilaginosa TaxID=3057676 RepID=A0ABU7JBD8_9GAMM|nr:hypothetical protein [Alkalimonas sp. MEB004]MEE2022999.1 hypothetical protein [Alkalimonas sp. MEB004]
MLKKVLGASLLSTLLIGCGGSGSSSSEDTGSGGGNTGSHDIQISGVVTYESPMAGVQVCADLNKNLRCDDGEPTATTTTDGSYQLNWTSGSQDPDYYLLAYWPKTSDLIPLTTISQNSDEIAIGALKQHQGAINPLTTLTLDALRVAIQQGYNSTQQQQLLTDLNLLHADIYQLPANEVYQKVFEAEHYLALMKLHIRLIVETLLVAGEMHAKAPAQVVQQLHQELLARMQAENLSVLELFGQHAEEISARVEQVLFELGYGNANENEGEGSTPPFNASVLNAADWEVVKASLFRTEPREFYLKLDTLTRAHAELVYGEDSIAIVQGQLFDDANWDLVVTQCWNNERQQWVHQDDIELLLTNQTDNSIDADFVGSGVPLRYRFSKIDTSSEQWNTLIEDSYEHFRLYELDWPEVVYRYEMQLPEPVLCRELDYNTEPAAPLLADSVQQLNTQDVAEMFFPQEFAEGKVTADNEAQRFTINVSRHYEWQLVTAPDNSQLIRLSTYGEIYPNAETTYYFAEDGQMFEVELITPETFEQIKAHSLYLALPEELALSLEQHLRAVFN